MTTLDENSQNAGIMVIPGVELANQKFQYVPQKNDTICNGIACDTPSGVSPSCQYTATLNAHDQYIIETASQCGVAGGPGDGMVPDPSKPQTIPSSCPSCPAPTYSCGCQNWAIHTDVIDDGNIVSLPPIVYDDATFFSFVNVRTFKAPYVYNGSPEPKNGPTETTPNVPNIYIFKKNNTGWEISKTWTLPAPNSYLIKTILYKTYIIIYTSDCFSANAGDRLDRCADLAQSCTKCKLYYIDVSIMGGLTELSYDGTDRLSADATWISAGRLADTMFCVDTQNIIRISNGDSAGNGSALKAEVTRWGTPAAPESIKEVQLVDSSILITTNNSTDGYGLYKYSNNREIQTIQPPANLTFTGAAAIAKTKTNNTDMIFGVYSDNKNNFYLYLVGGKPEKEPVEVETLKISGGGVTGIKVFDFATTDPGGGTISNNYLIVISDADSGIQTVVVDSSMGDNKNMTKTILPMTPCRKGGYSGSCDRDRDDAPQIDLYSLKDNPTSQILFILLFRAADKWGYNESGSSFFKLSYEFLSCSSVYDSENPTTGCSPTAICNKVCPPSCRAEGAWCMADQLGRPAPDADGYFCTCGPGPPSLSPTYKCTTTPSNRCWGELGSSDPENGSIWRPNDYCGYFTFFPKTQKGVDMFGVTQVFQEDAAYDDEEDKPNYGSQKRDISRKTGYWDRILNDSIFDSNNDEVGNQERGRASCGNINDMGIHMNPEGGTPTEASNLSYFDHDHDPRFIKIVNDILFIITQSACYSYNIKTQKIQAKLTFPGECAKTTTSGQCSDWRSTFFECDYALGEKLGVFATQTATLFIVNDISGGNGNLGSWNNMNGRPNGGPADCPPSICPPSPGSSSGTSSKSTSKKKLTKGQIAGIVIGSVCGFALIVGFIIYFIRKRRRQAIMKFGINFI